MGVSNRILTSIAMIGVAGTLQAQTPGQPARPTQPQVKENLRGTPDVKTVSMTGEVVRVQGDTLLAKMEPLGNYSVFNVQPGREFIIDGQTKHIMDLQPGTVLTATITTTTTPVTMRTTETLNGTVWWAQGNYVVLTLPNGQNHEYKVPDTFQFMVEGKPATVKDLRQGMKVTATKIVEEPFTEISTQASVTGRAPKK